MASHVATAVSDSRVEQFLLMERAVLSWIETVLELSQPLPKDGPRAHALLRNGVILCQLMQEIEPKSIPRIQDHTNHAWKLRENINFFLAACEDLKIPRFKIFKIADLYGEIERVNQSTAQLDQAAMKAAINAVSSPPPSSSKLASSSATSSSSTPKLVPPPSLHRPPITAFTLSQQMVRTGTDFDDSLQPFFGGNWPAVVQTLEAVARISHLKGLTQPMSEVPAALDLQPPFSLFGDLSREQKIALKHKLSRLREQVSVGKVKISTGILKRQLEYILNAKEGKTTFEKLEKGIIRFQSLVRGHFQRKIFKKIVRDVAFREKVAGEILATERTFLHSLDICLRIFLTPLTDGSKQLLRQEDIDGIFCNIQKIQELQQPFLHKLEERVAIWFVNQKISDIFEDYLQQDVVNIYSKYVENFDYSVTILTRLMKTNPGFAQFIKESRERPEVAGLDLSAFLITPVQRIPRYNLLLRDLLKYTQVIAGPDGTHPDIEGLTAALTKMESMAKMINERKRQSESILRVGEIADFLIGIEINLVEPNRYYVKEITLADERTVVYLFNDLILFGKKKGLKATEIRYSHFYPLRDFTVRDSSKEKSHTIELLDNIKGKSMMKLPFVHVADKDFWFKKIQELKSQLPPPDPSASPVTVKKFGISRNSNGEHRDKDKDDDRELLSPLAASGKGGSLKTPKQRPLSGPITGLFGRSKSPGRKSSGGNQSQPTPSLSVAPTLLAPGSSASTSKLGGFGEEDDKSGPAIGFSLKFPTTLIRAISPGKKRMASTSDVTTTPK